MNTQLKQNVDQHVLLIGRPPLGEFLSFIEVLAVDGRNADKAGLAAEWRGANDHIKELEASEAGLADNPELGELLNVVHPLRNALVQDGVFQKSFQLVPTTIQMVELDRLVVYQKHINLLYVQNLRDRLSAAPTAEELFEFCLPQHPSAPEVQVRQVAQNSFVFVSASDDIRFNEAALLGPEQITGFVSHGRPVGILALLVGFGSNFLNAFHFENRLILNNGSHRAFALREHGVTHVPCIVQHVGTREEFEVVGAQAVQQNYDAYLKTARPPMLKDYFDPALRKVVQVARKTRMVKVSFGVEVSDMPG